MHFKVGIGGIDQTIVGVGQFGIAGESGGFRAAEQYLETRVLADPKAPAEGVGAKAIHCQRHQPFPVQSQQCCSIARQQATHGLQQAAVAFLVGQIAGQVADQGQEGGEQWLCSHMDSYGSI